jgi:hypothetical protein
MMHRERKKSALGVWLAELAERTHRNVAVVKPDILTYYRHVPAETAVFRAIPAIVGFGISGWAIASRQRLVNRLKTLPMHNATATPPSKTVAFKKPSRTAPRMFRPAKVREPPSI